MANRKSWRRAVAPHGAPTNVAPTTNRAFVHKPPAALTFAGIKDDALGNVMGALLAKEVTVNAVDGCLYAGLFGGTENSSNELCLMLRYGEQVKGSVKSHKASCQDRRGGTSRKILIPLSQVLSVSAAQIDFNAYRSNTAVPEGANATRMAFATDGEISRGNSGAGRQLKRFDDFVDMKPASTPAPSLDEQTFGEIASTNGRISKKWDQFQVNESKFGVKTSFDEDEYTTKIDRRGVNFAERQREAERLASEIEGKSSENVHMREERNQEIGTDYDEEDLYSGVQRTAAPSTATRAPAAAPESSKPAKAAAERPRLSYAAAAAGSSKSAAPAPVEGTARPLVTNSSSSTSVEGKEKDTAQKPQKSNSGKNRPSKESLPQIAKIRSAATGRTSPKQSRNSPLTTPAPTDSSAVAVLNLDARTPNIGPEQIKRFEEYRTNREMQSIAENREKITDSLKKFSTQLDSRNVPLRRGQSGGSTGSSSVTSADGKGAAEVVKMDSSAAPENEAVKPITGQQAEPKKPEAKSDMKTEPKLESKPEEVVEAKVEVKPEPQPETKQEKHAVTTTTKPKSKLKVKLNPNAQEFKFNPDAPSFEPVSQKASPPAPTPKVYNNPYQGGNHSMDYSQPTQSGPQGYPLPMQTVGHIPYAQPYTMVVPGSMPGPIAPTASGYQFVQGNQPSFPISPVQGRYSQSPGVPSYVYPMHPNVVMAQPPQRMPSAPYPYYGSGPYPGGQGGAAHMSPPHQQQVYPPHMQQGGAPHMQGSGMPMGGRGGHSNARRGGGGKGRGKHHGHHSQGHHSSAGANNVDKSGQRTSESGMAVDTAAQR